MAVHTLLSADILRQLELLKLRARRTFLGTRQGGHLSLKRGHGIEFSDYRKYELGDDPRHIDWDVYARSEKLYVKRFQEEQDLSVSIILDSSKSMFSSASSQKWLTARSIAGSIAYVALMQQDRVAVSIPGIYEPPFQTGGAAFHNITASIMAIENAYEGDFYTASRQAISKLSFPGVAVFISDFLMPLTEIRQIFRHMQSLNLDITAIQVLSPEDLNPLQNVSQCIAVDSESGDEHSLNLSEENRKEYAFLLQSHIESLNDALKGMGIAFSSVKSDQNLSSIIVDTIANTGLFQ